MSYRRMQAQSDGIFKVLKCRTVLDLLLLVEVCLAVVLDSRIFLCSL